MKRVSIRDIANKAGVVPSTVSFVLNGKAKKMRISDKLAEKIRTIAEETGYTPHRAAVSLRTGKTNILGLIVEDISNVFFASLAKTIEDEAYASGYRVVYCSTENDPLKGKDLLKMLLNQQVEGFLITPTPGMEADIEKLRQTGKPVVLMDRFFEGTKIPHVLVDNYNGVKMAIEHLYSQGYRNIGFVTVGIDQIQMNERLRGYTETLEMLNLPLKKNNVLTLNYNRKDTDAVPAIKAWLQRKNHPDAVLFATNYLGIAGLEAIRSLEYAIPEDLAMICFDDHDIFRYYTPSVTTISQPIEEIAREAVQLLLDSINNTEVDTKELSILKTPALITREST